MNTSANSSLAGASKSFLLPLDCIVFRKSKLIMTSFSITNILLTLPLSTLILHLGYQRWRQRRSSVSSAAPAASQANIFTYQMVYMEMVGVLGCLLYCVGVNANLPKMFTCGFYMFVSTYAVKLHFNTLTCVQHYLAVVRPVTYLGLKSRRRGRIRKINTGCVWLLCFLFVTLMNQTSILLSLAIFFLFALAALIAICFCCISVLCALRRPPPGEAGGDRERTHQMKQRAFNTVVGIMGALWLCLGGMIVCIALVALPTLSTSEQCTILASAVWFSFPSSFVLPLQYLHRAGKLPGSKRRIT